MSHISLIFSSLNSRLLFDAGAKIAYKRNLLTKFRYSYGFPKANNDEESTEEARAELLPHLGWMKTLKSLVILRGDSPSGYYQDDYFIHEFLFWLKEVKGGSFINLERFWIEEDDLIFQFEDGYMTGPLVKSFVLPQEAFSYGYPLVLDDARYQQLEHLSNIIFSPLEQLSDLKYIRGKCELGGIQVGL